MASRIGRQIISRAYSSAAGPSAVAGEHGGGSRTWKILSFVVAVPGVALCYINAQIQEKEHWAHWEQPEFHEYEHLRLRTKPFPWGNGDKSLFHNSHTNALPSGYEPHDDH